MMTRQRAASIVALLTVGSGSAFALGILTLQMPDYDAWMLPFIPLALPALITGVAIRVLTGHRGERRLDLALASLSALAGAVLLAGMLAFFVLGVFIPYLAGWGGREIDQFGGHDFTWSAWLSTLLAMAGVAGGVIGAVVGLLSWACRPILRGSR